MNEVVYVLQRHDDTQGVDEPYGIFSTLEKAKECKAECGGGDHYKVHEWTIDEIFGVRPTSAQPPDTSDTASPAPPPFE